MTAVKKIDSNITGLRFAEEASIGVLPGGSPVWYPLEPNSYADFGGQITTVARNPINPSRQRKKGSTTDLEASGGFNTDVTQVNLQRLLQGFMFADFREKVDTIPFNGTVVPITSVETSTDDYNAASGLDDFSVGDLVFASGVAQAANNGLKRVTAVLATALSVAQNLVDETTTASARLVQVGFQFGSGEVEIVVSGSLLVLNRVSGTKNFTDFGLIPGEWIYIGGDTAPTVFANAANNGFARVRSVTATSITFDKTSATMVADAGAAKTIQIFFGRVLKNESNPDLIKRRTFQLERTLGFNDDADQTENQAEYLIGAVPSEFVLNVPTADKMTADVSFVAIDNETADENKGDDIKSEIGTAIALQEADAFNTSSDIKRIRLSQVVDGNPFPAPLFAFVQEFTLNINNNLTPNKAVSILGAFDVSAGTFQVGASITAYFADVAAIQAVRNNANITLDFIAVKSNSGICVDLPLVALGDGRPNVSQDEPITIPLTTEAATGALVNPTLDHTLLMVFWDYLPSAADI